MYNMRGVWGVGCEYKLLVKERGSGVSCILTSPLLLCFNRIIQFCLFQELLFLRGLHSCCRFVQKDYRTVLIKCPGEAATVALTIGKCLPTGTKSGIIRE